LRIYLRRGLPEHDVDNEDDEDDEEEVVLGRSGGGGCFIEQASGR